MLIRFLSAAALCVVSFAGVAEEAKGPRVLFLTKSSGFQHSVIFNKDGAPSHAEKTMIPIVEGLGGTLVTTKDAKLINAENLKNYDVVVFYTTGDLTEPGFDRTTPMAKEGPDELLNWIKAGGGFVGFHCASDTFHGEGDTVTPYIAMVGGEFAGHGPQFFGHFIVSDAGHPAMVPIKSPWRVNEEWYYFKNLDKENMHVLALLDARRAASKMKHEDQAAHREAYGASPYPIAWCKGYGEGRVLYNGMGHREDVWDAPEFQQSIAGALTWAAGEGELNAEPNYEAAIAAAMNREEIKAADAE